MLATVGPMSLERCKFFARRSGWTENQPTQIFKNIMTERQVMDHIQSELDSLETKIKTPPKSGFQFS